MRVDLGRRLFHGCNHFLRSPAAVAAERSGTDAPKQVIDGRLTGFDMPADWKLSERAKRLTYTNPFGQNIAPRWGSEHELCKISDRALNTLINKDFQVNIRDSKI